MSETARKGKRFLIVNRSSQGKHGGEVTTEPLTGAWREYVAATRSLTDAGSNPMPKAEGAKGEYQELLSTSVQELLRLYQQMLDGFLSNSAAAMPVRAIGQKLHEAGGFELMLEAHALFAARNPGMGFARNLEMIWDGVGNWRG